MPGAAYIVSIMSSMSVLDLGRDRVHRSARRCSASWPCFTMGRSMRLAIRLRGGRAPRGAPARPRAPRRSCADFLERIAAELLEERVGDDEGDHRLADDGGGGTAQTSLRSMAAGDSCSVVRSTDRSGFISVAIGFM
jgi:hypothetical protein